MNLLYEELLVEYVSVPCSCRLPFCAHLQCALLSTLIDVLEILI